MPLTTVAAQSLLLGLLFSSMEAEGWIDRGARDAARGGGADRCLAGGSALPLKELATAARRPTHSPAITRLSPEIGPPLDSSETSSVDVFRSLGLCRTVRSPIGMQPPTHQMKFAF
ncbi:MAG: hypothetical protein AB7O55_12635 [Lautropia sp.]